MKTLPNKEIELTIEEDKKWKYSDLFKLCVIQTKEWWFTPLEMKQRMKLIDVADNSKENIEIEDWDYNEAKLCVNNMKWSILHKDITDFTDEINKL